MQSVGACQSLPEPYTPGLARILASGHEHDCSALAGGGAGHGAHAVDKLGTEEDCPQQHRHVRTGQGVARAY